MNRIMKVASVVVALALANSAQAKEFVVNGDFSQLSNGLGQLNYDGFTVANGWSTTHNYGYNFVMNVADVGANGQYGTLSLYDYKNDGDMSWSGMSPTGDNFAAMDGAYDVAALTQTITGLKAGDSYTLSFLYAFGQQTSYTGPTVQFLDGTFGGSTFTTPVFDVANHGFTGWQTYTHSFTANSTSEVLSFLAHGDMPVPPFSLLTDVSLIAAVPEPATWAMMLIGMGMVGVAARRRHTVNAAYA